MSYRCAECNKVHYGKALPIIKDIRSVDYVRSKVYFDREEKKYKPVFEAKFDGWEIHKQVNVCSKCFESLKDKEPNIGEQKIVNFFIKNDSNRNFKIEDKQRDKQRIPKHNKATNRNRRGNRGRDNIYEDGK